MSPQPPRRAELIRAQTRLVTFAGALTATVGLLAAAASAAPLRWSGGRQIDRSGGLSLGALACPSASRCEALDADGRLVGFDPAAPAGAARVQISGPAPLGHLACAS